MIRRKKKNKNKKKRGSLDRRLPLGLMRHEEVTIIAEFGCFGKSNFKGCGIAKKTFMIRNVRSYEDGQMLAQHLWVDADEVDNVEILNGHRIGTIVLRGVVYPYGDTRRGKVVEKYGLGDAHIVRFTKAEDVPKAEKRAVEEKSLLAQCFV